MRHLIAPSSMLEVAPTSIQSSSQKGMRTHHPSLSRSRRDTPSSGHEHLLPPPRLSARCGLREETFDGTRVNGQDAPEDPMGVRIATGALPE
jgi:hypothetical protein